jgi:hypothetical protein
MDTQNSSGGSAVESTKIQNPDALSVILERLAKIEEKLQPPKKARLTRTGKVWETQEEYMERVGVSREVVAIGLLISGVTKNYLVADTIGVHRYSLTKAPEFARYRALLGTLQAGGSVLSFVNSSGVREDESDDE